jgi:hypothetical protein
MAVSDPAVLGHLPTLPAAKEGLPPEVISPVRYGAGIAGAVLVFLIGKLVMMRRAQAGGAQA